MGDFIQETVKIGDLEIDHQLVGLVTEEEGKFLKFKHLFQNLNTLLF